MAGLCGVEERRGEERMWRCPFELVPAGVGLERLSFFVIHTYAVSKLGLGWAGLG